MMVVGNYHNGRLPLHALLVFALLAWPLALATSMVWGNCNHPMPHSDYFAIARRNYANNRKVIISRLRGALTPTAREIHQKMHTTSPKMQ